MPRHMISRRRLLFMLFVLGWLVTLDFAVGHGMKVEKDSRKLIGLGMEVSDGAETIHPYLGWVVNP